MKKIITVVLLLAISGYTHTENFSYAQSAPEAKQDEVTQLQDKLQTRQSQVLKNWSSKLFYTQSELEQEQQKLNNRMQELAKVSAEITEYQKQIETLGKNLITLNNELSILEKTMELTKLQIRNVQIQIAEREQNIKNTHEKIAITEVAKKEQDRIVSEFIRLLYKQNQIYFSPEKNFTTDISYFASSQGLSEILSANRYATIMRKSGSDFLSDLEDVDTLLSIRKKQLADEQMRLSLLQTKLAIEEKSLNDQSIAKAQLIEKTQGEQKNFETLLAENQKEQDAIEEEVRTQQLSIKDIESKLEAFQKNMNSSSLTPEEIAERAKILAQLGEGGKIGLSWPIQPTQGLSAHFQDPSYVKVFGVGHNAIDIPSAQGTEIKAPADGYVTKVKDAGLGYSYIMLAHNGGVMTLYGHVSKILVRAGDIVKRGDIIGHVGGTPGTSGAGWMTTGPHLHFEVFQNGKHVDPQAYLDNSVLKK